jgi:large subunit ribosomal protein L25
MNKTITVMVPLTFINEPHNRLQSANAVLTHLWREVELTCLPRDIPDEIVVDLADIHPGATFKADALVLPPGVTLVTDPEEVIVTAHVEAQEVPEASSAEAEAAP